MIVGNAPKESFHRFLSAITKAKPAMPAPATMTRFPAKGEVGVESTMKADRFGLWVCAVTMAQPGTKVNREALIALGAEPPPLAPSGRGRLIAYMHKDCGE